MQVVMPVASNRLQKFAAEQRAFDHAEFTIHRTFSGTDEPTSDHFTVTAAEPIAANPGALGADQALGAAAEGGFAPTLLPARPREG